MMRSTPERLSFSYRLLLAFALPLIIWVLVSLATVIALQDSLRNRAAVAGTQQVIALAAEYFNLMSVARESERAFLINSTQDALVEYRSTLARANNLHAQLAALVSDDTAQAERLEHAGESFQAWFHDISAKRVATRSQLQHGTAREAQLVERQLLLLTAAHARNAAPSEAHVFRLRTGIQALQATAAGANRFGQALEQLDRYSASLQSDSPLRANEELQALIAALVPGINAIIDLEHSIETSVSHSEGLALVRDFRDTLNSFIDAEQRELQQHQDNATIAARVIQWVIWTGLVTGVISILIVTAFVAGRLRRSVLSIDHVTDELAKGNWSARVAGHGRFDKLANRFNLMAELMERRSQETKLLGELGETLHNCTDIEEALHVFGQFAEMLFPAQPGVLYMIEPNGTDVSSTAAWGGGDAYSAVNMTTNDCWGLRLGRVHDNGTAGTVRCAHVAHAEVASRCIPLPAFGEIIGMLFVTQPEAPDTAQREQQAQFTESVAEQVALAFANVRLRETLRNQSIRDPLTQLFNRRHLDEVFMRELYRAERHKEPLSIVSFDIDRFKAFNDQHGHDGGDAVLKSIGELLRDFFRPEDDVFRTGGEEFIALLPGTAVEDALVRAEELRQAIAAMIIMHGNVRLPSVTASIGVASYPEDGPGEELLLKAADRALYKAKETGRNRVMAARDL